MIRLVNFSAWRIETVLAARRFTVRQRLNLFGQRFSFETRSLPTLTRPYPRRFTFYVARPTRSIPLFSFFQLSTREPLRSSD